MSKAQSAAKSGEHNPRSRLRAKDVREIRRKAARSAKGKRGWKAALAREYGISAGTLADILSGRRWANAQQNRA